MEWWIWFASWFLFNFWHPRLIWIYHQKKHETLAENPLIQIYPIKIKSRIAFKIKTGYKLESLSPETMKLWGSTKKDDNKDKDGEDVLKTRICGSCFSAL